MPTDQGGRAPPVPTVLVDDDPDHSAPSRRPATRAHDRRGGGGRSGCSPGRPTGGADRRRTRHRYAAHGRSNCSPPPARRVPYHLLPRVLARRATPGGGEGGRGRCVGGEEQRPGRPLRGHTSRGVADRVLRSGARPLCPRRMRLAATDGWPLSPTGGSRTVTRTAPDPGGPFRPRVVRCPSASPPSHLPHHVPPFEDAPTFDPTPGLGPWTGPIQPARPG
jgi:hypothetical protein